MIPENKNEDIVKVNYPITKMQIKSATLCVNLHSKNYNACINSLNNRQDYSTRV